MDLASVAQALSVWFLPVIVAITFHEAAHGWMAERCGDDTARVLGRVSFNPLKHVDAFGTLLLPALLLLLRAPILIGYAKPVPVAFHRLNNPKRDGIWVALAGPGANVILAYVSALAFHALFYLVAQDVVAADVIMWIGDNLQNSMKINILLAVFNMLPIPPLDGGRVMLGLLPDRYARGFARLQRYELLIVMALLVTLLLAGEPLFRVISPIVNALYVLLWDLAGLP